MQRQQSEYASQSFPYERFAQENRPLHTSKKRQKRILAGVSLGLWALVSFFVFWNNSGNPNTFTNADGASYMQSEHFLLISGFIIFTCLLLFVNFIFRPQPSTTRSTTDNAGKLHDKPVIHQLLQNNKYLFITTGSLLLWVGIFITSVWQLSNHPLAFVHYILYNPSVFNYFPDQTVDAWITLFMIISYLLFFLNKRLYRRTRKKLYEE
jgi:hypothetical protein